MYETTLTLITRQLGIELPFEILKIICKNTIVRVPFSEEILRPYILRATGLYTYNQIRLTPMRCAIDKSLNDLLGVRPGIGTSFLGIPDAWDLHKYTPAHRKTQENMDIKAFCLDMERQHNPLSWMQCVPKFDGWITCGKPVGKYRKFELTAIWPTLYGKNGWANKLKKQ